jgi:hypothetical protein
MHEKYSLSVQVKASKRLGSDNRESNNFCKGILPLTFISINNDKRASDDLMCLASLIYRF